MSKKLGDEVCRYKDPETGFIHVKFCEERKYCKPLITCTETTIYTCQNITKIIPLKNYEESCDSDFECEKGLYCKRGTISNKCSRKNLCQDNYIPVKNMMEFGDAEVIKILVLLILKTSMIQLMEMQLFLKPLDI